MMSNESEVKAWADLLFAELAWKQEREHITTRAQLYIEAGLPLERVLDALKLSRSGWYKRIATVEAAQAARLADAEERERAREAAQPTAEV